MLLLEERALIAEYCKRLEPDGLVVGTAGNISVRVGDRVAVTPTGVAYRTMTAEQICVIDYETGELIEGEYQPTSEYRLHLQVLHSTGLGSVVHTHSTYATAVASLEGVTCLPDVHYVTAMFGGALPVTEYACYGSQLLADRVEEALADRTGCLLGNHGAVAAAKDLHQAYTKAQTIEWLAKVWLIARSAGTPRILSPEQMAEASSSIATYGQPIKAKS